MRNSDHRRHAKVPEKTGLGLPVRLRLAKKQADGVAVALERLGCKVLRAAFGGTLYVTPPNPHPTG